MKLSQELRRHRQSQGLSMKKVAEAVQVPVSTYRDWEYGSKVPANVAPRLAEVLGVSTRDLLGLTKSQPELYEVLLLLEDGVSKLRRIWLQENA
jgi:transcriptional regulator with XRE-family HTH domain